MSSKPSKTTAKWWLSPPPGSIFHKATKEADLSLKNCIDDPKTQFILPPDIKITPTISSKPSQSSKSSKSKPLTPKMVSKFDCATAFKLCFSEITVEPILFLYMLSTFSQYALFQDLVYSRACLHTFPTDICDNLHSPSQAEELETVQKEASHWILMSTISLVLPSIFIAIYLGSWSDKFGRKWPIVFPPLGGVLGCIVLIVLAFRPQVPIGWICLASFLSGLSGGFVSCIMSCMTYVASVSTEDNRTVRISRLEAMIFLGGTVGPFLSGSVLQYIGHGCSFIFMMVCYAVASLYAFFCVKEVRDDQLHPRKSLKTATNPNRPQSAASSISAKSKTTTLDSSSGTVTDLDHLDLESGSGDHLLPVKPPDNKDLDLNLHLPDVARSAAVYVDCSHQYQTNKSKHTCQYQSIRSIEIDTETNLHEDSSSTAASEDEQRNILRRSRSASGDSDERGQDMENVSCCTRYFGSGHFTSALKTVVVQREGGRRLYLILILMAGYIGMMITAGELDVAYLFAKGEPLKWSHQIFSYYFGFKYGLGTLVLLIGMPICQHFQIKDTTICILGLVSRMAGLVLYALSPDTTIAFLVPIVAIFSFFSIPATRSLLSKLVSPDEQGKIFAFVAIMEDLCTMSASMVFNSLYPLTRPILKGFIFLLAAALLIIPILIMWFIGRRLTRLESISHRQPESHSDNVEDQISDKGDHHQHPHL